jgi:serine/threonine protein kinase
MAGVMAVEPGLRLSGRYRLVRPLDGEVWRAWDEALNRPVALRAAAPSPDRSGPGDGDGALRERIVRAVRVEHPAFVTVYDCDIAQDGDGPPVPFVVTALPSGDSLARRIAEGPLPVAMALDCCAQVAEALAGAHEAGVPHGALCPENIFLTPDGVRILDLGFVPSGTDPAEDADVTALGEVIAACLDALPPGDVPGLPEEVVRLCSDCRSPEAGDRPTAAHAAGTLREAARPAPVPDQDDRVGATLLQPLPEPPEEPTRDEPVLERLAARLPAISGVLDRWAAKPPADPGVMERVAARLRADPGVLVRVAATATLLAVSLATVLVIANRGSRTGALPGGGVPAAPATSAPATSAPATSAPGTPSTVPVPVVYQTLGRLQPIVDSGQASGRIRSDVAVDLNNSITNLRNDLAAGRTAEASRNLSLLREKIDTRLRERALDERVAAQMTDVLAGAPS